MPFALRGFSRKGVKVLIKIRSKNNYVDNGENELVIIFVDCCFKIVPYWILFVMRSSFKNRSKTNIY